MENETDAPKQSRVKRMFVMAVKQFEDPYFQGVPAQLSFYIFLSLVPTVILLSQVLGLFSMSLEGIETWVEENFKGDNVKMITGVLEYSPSGVNSVFLAFTALWAASRTQFAMMRVTNYILSDGRTTGEGYIIDRVRAIKTILITIFTVVFSLVVLVYGPMLVNLVVGRILGGNVAGMAWLALRWPLAFAMYFLMISYNYYVLPSQRVSFREVVPGSIFAAVGFLAVTFFYNLYTEKSTNYDILYGSFSNIVALLFWLMFISWVLIIGVMLNRVWIATRKRNPIFIGEGIIGEKRTARRLKLLGKINNSNKKQ